MKKPSARPAAPEGHDLAENPESFRLRQQWFAEDRPGFDTPKRAAEIGAMIAGLRQPRASLDRDPGGGQPDGFGLVNGGRLRAALAAGPPEPGMATATIEVSGAVSLHPAALKLSVDPATLAALDPATIRVFRRDPGSGAWRVVPASGFNPAQAYAWCLVLRPGRYAALGLPASKKSQALIWKSLPPDPLPGLAPNSDRRPLRLTAATSLRDAFAGAFRRRLAASGAAGLPEWELLRELAIQAAQTHALSGSLPSGGARVLRNWLSSGPENFSGRIRSIALHATRPQRLVAGTANGGVWVSSDSGRIWRPTMFNEMSLAIGSCAMAPGDFRILYAATGEGGHGPITSYAGVGVYKSTDFGSTWTLCPGSPAGRCQRMLIDPSDAAIAYAAMDTGLYKTTDGGATWANVYPGVRVTDAVIHPSQGKLLLIGVEDDGVFRTRDGGVTWAREQNTHPDGDKMPTGDKAGWVSLGIVRYSDSGRARFAVKLGLRGEQVFVSSRNGRLDKWSEVDDTDDSSWRNLIALDPHREDTLFAGSVGLYRVVDDDWDRVDGTHDDHHDMAFHPTNKNRAWVATDGGLYASIDGGSNWRKASPRLTATQFYSLDVSQAGPFLMVGSTQDEGILRSRGTAEWEDTKAGNEGGFVAIDPSDSRHVFARPWSTGLRRSDDFGESWTTLERGLRIRYRGIDSKPAYIRGFAVKPDNGKVLVAAGALSVTRGEKETEIFHKGCIFRSVDRGDTWARRKLATGDGRSVAFAPSNPRICYAGMANGRVFRSADAGKTWALRQRGTVLLTSDPVNAIAVDIDDARVLYACLGGSGSVRVMRSRDSGRTWTDLSGVATGRALPTVSCNSLVQDPDHPDVLYVATDIGIFRSGDGGESWYSFNESHGGDDLPRVLVTRLVLQRRLRLLFASTIGRGVWRIRV